MSRPQTYPRPITERPSYDDLEEWAYDGLCETTDGCMVEPDGWCEHGHVSWLIYLGLV
jgi:hypothetical protein